MRGIKIGEYHSADDWELILNSKTINPPTPKYVRVPVDGRDGDLDLSEALTGEIKYNDREASFTFLLTNGSYSDREELIGEIINYVHGQRRDIILPDDTDHYLVGRCSVADIHNDKAYGSIKITATCEPYRYSVNEVNRVITATSTSTDVILSNVGRKTVTPTLIIVGEVSLTFADTSVTLGAGTYKLSALNLKAGQTIVSVKGSGTVTFNYREAIL